MLFLFGARFPADTAADASLLERWCPADGEATAISLLKLWFPTNTAADTSLL
jgi:hypothetical protein